MKRKYSNTYYENNRKHSLEYNRDYYYKHIEERKEYAREYYKKNKSDILKRRQISKQNKFRNILKNMLIKSN